MVRDAEPLPPKSLRPDVPVDLDTICMKCLEKSAERRYASAAELADDLTAFLKNRPIRARPIGHIARLVRWGKRNRTVAVAWSVIIASLATLVVIRFVVAKRERDAFRVQTVLLIEANAAKEKLRQAWKTTLDQTGNSLSAMTKKFFKLGIPLKDLPSEERDIHLRSLVTIKKITNGVATSATQKASPFSTNRIFSLILEKWC